MEDEETWDEAFDAARTDDLAALRGMVNRGLDVNVKADGFVWDRLTLLHEAAEEGHPDTVQFLIGQGAIVDAIGRDKRTALHFAAEKGHLAVVEILIENRANVNARDTEDCTPLHLAADENVCRILVENGADIEAADLDLWRPLHYAVFEENMKKAICLLERGASVNSQDIDGNTPCHVAADHKGFDLLKILLPHMKENLCNAHNQTVFDLVSQYYAARRNSEEISWLRSRCTKKNPCKGDNLDVFDLISQYYAAIKDSKEFSFLQRRCRRKNPCKAHDHFKDFGDLYELLTEFKVLKAPPVKLDNLPKSRSLEIKDICIDQYFPTMGNRSTEDLVNLLTGPDEAEIILEKLPEMEVSKKNKYFKKLLKRFAHPRSYWTTSGHRGYDVAVRVEKFVRDFLGKAADIDPRFAGTLEPVGSCADGTRLGEPEEFDFLLTIQDFGNVELELFEDASDDEAREGFVEVRFTGKDIQNRWEPLLNHDHELDPNSVLSYFYHLLRENSRRLEVRPMKTGCTLQLHCLETGLWIDVDVGLGIKFSGWPDRNQPVIAFDELRKVVPPSVKDEEVCYYSVPRMDAYEWQLSFVTLEKVILSHIDERLLNVLKILKTLNALLKAKKDKRWPSDYVMKTAFLHYLASTKLVSGDNFSLTETVVEILKNFCGNGFQSPIYSFFLPKRKVWYPEVLLPSTKMVVTEEFERLIHRLESVSPPQN